MFYNTVNWDYWNPGTNTIKLAFSLFKSVHSVRLYSSQQSKGVLVSSPQHGKEIIRPLCFGSTFKRTELQKDELYICLQVLPLAST